MVHSNIQAIIKKYKDLHDNLTERVMQAEAIVMLDQLDKGFKDQRSPYGPSWPKKKDGTIFDPNHDLQNSFNSDHTDHSSTIKSEFISAIYHQYGTDNLPERKMIPEEGRGFGFWKAPMLNAARKVVKDTMNGTYIPLVSSRSKSSARASIKAAKTATRLATSASNKKKRADKRFANSFLKRLNKRTRDKRSEHEKIQHIHDLIGDLK